MQYDIFLSVVQVILENQVQASLQEVLPWCLFPNSGRDNASSLREVCPLESVNLELLGGRVFVQSN